MIFKYGKHSERELETVHMSLGLIAREALAYGIIDLGAFQGYRGMIEQNEYFKMGKSEAEWPNGKHNSKPSLALDIVPYVAGRLSWNKLHCCVAAGVILSAAVKLGIPIRWGGNWDCDGEPITDQDFQDLVHYELLKV